MPVLKQLDFLTRVPRLTVSLVQFRLMVIKINMTRRPRHEELDNSSRLGRPMANVQHAISGAGARIDSGEGVLIIPELTSVPQHIGIDRAACRKAFRAA